MSFCMRSLSNSSRYVPTLIGSAQGCNARTFSSRQLLKQVKPVSASTFLNEFLGSNSLRTSSFVNEEISKSENVQRELSKDFFQDHGVSHLNSQDEICTIMYSSNNEASEDGNKIYNMRTANDRLLFHNNFKSYEHEIPVNNEETNWIDINHRPRVSTTNVFTKDRTKVKYSTISNCTSALKETDSKVSLEADKNQDKDKRLPNENLQRVYEILRADLPVFFKKSLDYRIYHPDLEFVNNIRGKVTKGLFPYVKQMAFLRIVGHIKFAYVEFKVLKITMHTESNTVRVRWRISGVEGKQVFFSIFQHRIWKVGDQINKNIETWYDGFSTFYVGDDGLIYKHVADKMMPDEDVDKTKDGLQSKIASVSPLTFSGLK